MYSLGVRREFSARHYLIGGDWGKTLNTLASFTGINPSIERLATIIHNALRDRLEQFHLESLAVTIWEDDIAWTSYRTPL